MKKALIILAVVIAALVIVKSPSRTSSNLPWQTDLARAQTQAAQNTNLVFVLFTGSDWCPACKIYDGEILSAPEFAAYATNRLQLVKVDFLRRTPPPREVQAAQALLADQYRIEGFPTTVVLDAAGQEIWRAVGVPAGGPEELIAQLTKLAAGK